MELIRSCFSFCIRFVSKMMCFVIFLLIKRESNISGNFFFSGFFLFFSSHKKSRYSKNQEQHIFHLVKVCPQVESMRERLSETLSQKVLFLLFFSHHFFLFSFSFPKILLFLSSFKQEFWWIYFQVVGWRLRGLGMSVPSELNEDDFEDLLAEDFLDNSPLSYERGARGTPAAAAPTTQTPKKVKKTPGEHPKKTTGEHPKKNNRRPTTKKEKTFF